MLLRSSRERDMTNQISVLDRVEELWDVLAQEFDDGGPGGVVARVENAERVERDAIIAYLEQAGARPDMVENIRAGSHHT